MWINETHSNYVFFNMIYIGFEYASLELMFYIMFDYGASIMLKHHQSPDNALAISFYQNKMLAACPKCIFKYSVVFGLVMSRSYDLVFMFIVIGQLTSK